MNTSDEFSKAYNYTRAFLSRFGDLIILLVISIIPLLNLIAIGYYGRVVSDKTDSQAPPRLYGFWELFVGGLKAVVAYMIWSIPLILLFMIFFIPVYQTARWDHMMMMQMSQPLGFFVGAIGALATMTIIIVGFLIGILAIMGVVHMFKTGSFSKAFAVGELFNIIGRIGFFKYLFWLISAVVLGAIVGVFGLIPIVGWIISDVLSIMLFIFLARSIGLMYDSAASAQVEPTPPHPPTQLPPPPPPPPPPTSP